MHKEKIFSETQAKFYIAGVLAFYYCSILFFLSSDLFVCSNIILMYCAEVILAIEHLHDLNMYHERKLNG